MDYATDFQRGFTLRREWVALILVDLQYASASREFGLGRTLADRGEGYKGQYRFDRIENCVIPTVQELLPRFRRAGLPIIYLKVGSQVRDCSDVTPHMRELVRSTQNIEGNKENRVLEEISPSEGDIVLTKTTMSAFNSCGIERTLRSLERTQLCFAGVSTNSCVEGTARDAADCGFDCVLIEDGCAAANQELHEASLLNFSRLLGRVVSSEQLYAELGL